MNIEAKKILTNYWGHTSFRPLQEDIIESILQKKDTLALLPTGGGKSICFQVPALMIDGTCLVITPLIALMNDQVTNLKKLGINARSIHSGMHRSEVESVYSNCLHGKVKFLYVSPERLENDVFRDLISKMKVNIITVDEAHCISQWGYDFRPPYLRIADIRDIVSDAPILALTATATPVVAKDIVTRLRFKQRLIHRASFERKNLGYKIFKDADKTGMLLRMLDQERGSAIVYVRNRKKTRELADILNKNSISATHYHAGLDAKTREDRQKEWTLGQIKVMVSTNAFGMGIDKPDVRQVIHFDLPDCIESYFQEAGRAGRDTKPASASLIYHTQDVVNVKRKLKESFPPLSRIRLIYNALGNYYQLPEGSGKDTGFDFNIVQFSEQYEFNLMEVYSAIKFLEKEGYLFYSESAGQYSKLMIPISKENLYRYVVENPGSDRLLKEVMRSYAGIFTDYININEYQLAKRSEIQTNEVVSKLNYLDKLKVVSYIPIKKMPQLVYVTERLKAKNIHLSNENYIILKDAAETRLQSLLDLLTNSIQCRSQQLLAYFGEAKSKRCGICDVCLNKNKVELNEIEFELIKQKIREKILEKPMYLYDIVSGINDFEEENIISALRWLMDNNTVIRLNDETLKWHDQLDISFD